MILEGNVSVKAAILAGRRKVNRLIVDEASTNKDTASKETFPLKKDQEMK